jgi:hypothetical protein
MRNIFVHIVFILSIFEVFAQESRVSISQNSILIGEKITLTYSLPLEAKSRTKYNPAVGTLPSRIKSKTGILSKAISEDVEILTPFKDTILSDKGLRMWVGVYEVTVWDSGTYVIESPTILLDDSTIYFPSVVLNASLVEGKQGQDIYDIKESFAQIPDEPFSVKNFAKNNWWWLLPIVLIGIGMLNYFWKKKKNKPVERIIELPLKERTLLAIDALENERLWEKNRLKEHYIELSFIMRSYLSARYEINLLEKTTQETQLLLRQKGLHEETIQVVINVLSESDMVKFAKSQPEDIAVFKVSQLARQVVAETSPIEFNNA